MQVYRFNVPTFGKDVVFDVHHKVRAEQFKFFSEALKIAKMTDYVPLFVQEAEVRYLCFSSHTAAPSVGSLCMTSPLLCRTFLASGARKGWSTSSTSCQSSSS